MESVISISDPVALQTQVDAAAANVTAALRVMALASTFANLTLNWPESAQVNDGDWFDIVICGGGTAGLVLANRLSEITSFNIAVFEAGGNPPVESVAPGTFFLFPHTEQDWDFYGEYDPNMSHALREQRVALTRGKVLGGSSAIDHLLYERGSPVDFNAWESIGNPGWGYEDVLYYFMKQESLNDCDILLGSTKEYHCTNGLLGASHQYPTTAYKATEDVLLTSLAEIGFETLPDSSAPNTLGAYYTNIRVNKDSPYTRASTAQNYLLPFTKRSNLHILKNTLVTKVITEDGRATGVLVRGSDGVEKTIYASKEVIVSAGTYNSPKLLQLSGIGPKDLLESLDIEVVADLPVGEHLKDQPFVPMSISGNTSTSNTLEELVAALDVHTFPVPIVTGAFSVSDSGEPDVQHITLAAGATNYLYFYLLYVNFNYNTNLTVSFLKNTIGRDTIFSLVSVARAVSEGRVVIKSTDPNDAPLIYHNFLSNDDDMEILLKGLKKMYELQDTTYFKSVGSEKVDLALPECDALEKYSDDYWRCYIRNTVTTTFHPTGTCKMAPISAGGVVDERLRVHGVSGLRVVDDSIMPTQPAAKTAAIANMIAEKAADLIKEDYLQTVQDFTCQRKVNYTYCPDAQQSSTDTDSDSHESLLTKIKELFGSIFHLGK